MRIQALHCPSCGAPLDVAVHAPRVTCSYCHAVLIVEAERVSTNRALTPPAQRKEEEVAPYPEPDVTLSTWVAPRFELSFLEQNVADAPPEVFAGIELTEQRFALVYLRVVDADGRGMTADLGPAFEVLKESLASDADPGLAANLALDKLCEKPFAHKLECAIALFEPRHMRVTLYNAGCRDAFLWASSEQGRSITPGSAHDALEKKFLRETQDHFQNLPPIHLAAHDVVVAASAGFCGRGKQGHADGVRALHDTLNAQLGEEPLRIVTLAKNAYWENFQEHRRRKNDTVPSGHVKLAAVRAVLPPLAEAIPKGHQVHTVRTRRFELALLTKPNDVFRLVPLHGDRQVLVWLSPVKGELGAETFDKACAAIVDLLDRTDYGDNENPRRAGRDAYDAIAMNAAQVRMAVIQLFDAFERVKYYRAGWKQPLGLGPRGVRDGSGGQQFDEGGEATVNEGARLFFPGGLTYENQHGNAESFATVWSGGKASRLYEAFTQAWKTKKTAPALEKLARAAISDAPGSDLSGLALVTGVPA